MLWKSFTSLSLITREWQKQILIVKEKNIKFSWSGLFHRTSVSFCKLFLYRLPLNLISSLFLLILRLFCIEKKSYNLNKESFFFHGPGLPKWTLKKVPILIPTLLRLRGLKNFFDLSHCLSFEGLNKTLRS